MQLLYSFIAKAKAVLNVQRTMDDCDKLMGKLEDFMEFLSFSVIENRSFSGVVSSNTFFL